MSKGTLPGATAPACHCPSCATSKLILAMVQEALKRLAAMEQRLATMEQHMLGSVTK